MSPGTDPRCGGAFTVKARLEELRKKGLEHNDNLCCRWRFCLSNRLNAWRSIIVIKPPFSWRKMWTSRGCWRSDIAGGIKKNRAAQIPPLGVFTTTAPSVSLQQSIAFQFSQLSILRLASSDRLPLPPFALWWWSCWKNILVRRLLGHSHRLRYLV